MPLDDADKKFIAEAIAASIKPDTIGAAVKAHLDGLKLDEKIADKVKEATKDLPKGEEKGKDDDKSKDKGGKGKDDERINGLEQRLAASEKAREEAEMARRRDALESGARDALVKAGVPAERARHALAVLKADGLLDHDKDGKPGWKGKDRFGVDTLLSLEEGASAWVKSDDGKHYLPPVQTRGTGDKGGGGPSHNGNGGPVRLADLNLGAVLSRIGQ